MSAADLAAEADWPRERLDADYNARASVAPEVFEAAMARYRDLSAEAKASVGSHLEIMYDAASGQAFDVYGTRPGELRPAFLFVHGGYWRALSKDASSFMAPMLAEAGIATVAIDYRLAPAVTLAEIVREVRAGLAFLWHEAEALGIDRDRIFVGGSSAGGHLTGMLTAGGWHRAFGVPEDVVKGAMPVSGLFHLGPVARSFVSEWIELSPEEAVRLSPAENLPVARCPAIVAYAANEPAGFERQSRAYHRALLDAGQEARLMAIPGRDHFDVILDLAARDSAIGRALVDLIVGR